MEKQVRNGLLIAIIKVLEAGESGAEAEEAL